MNRFYGLAQQPTGWPPSKKKFLITRVRSLATYTLPPTPIAKFFPLKPLILPTSNALILSLILLALLVWEPEWTVQWGLANNFLRVPHACLGSRKHDSRAGIPIEHSGQKNLLYRSFCHLVHSPWVKIARIINICAKRPNFDVIFDIMQVSVLLTSQLRSRSTCILPVGPPIYDETRDMLIYSP